MKHAVMRILFSILVVSAAASVHAADITPSAYWKNQISFPNDAFRSVQSTASDIGWIKFVILKDDPNTVYFQDCKTYQFHSDFAIHNLDPFMGMTTSQFDQVSLYASGQQAILGTVIMPPILYGDPAPPQTQEYGIQFVRQDPYTAQEIVDMFNVVKSKIIADSGVETFYFPTFEQSEVAAANTDFFLSKGITVSSTARWSTGNVCYAPGWALGTLKYYSGDEISTAFLAGELKSSDILLTDGVPAEVPYVAGIISLTASTPNSHVAILSKTLETPFVYMAVPADAQRAQQMVGHRVALRAFESSGGDFDIELFDTNGKLTTQQVDEIHALKTPTALNYKPMKHFGAYSKSVAELVPSDICYFGGKASNFGILRTSIPDSSPMAVAFSFDLWNAFMDQKLDSGKTLRQTIHQKLDGYTYPPDFNALSTDLAAIQEMFKDTNVTKFTSSLQSEVLDTLTDPAYGFDPNMNLRFRSSTNMEDSDQFSGAGLYDSFSGCLADELDGDTAGPCLCDSTEAKERGVFRAIRKVYASFYNLNAFTERLRHGVNEDEVGMALVVHASYPDSYEMANGVATVQKTSSSTRRYIDLVSQKGANSVTNPEGGATPEEVTASVSASGTVYNLTVATYSNLVVIGDTVMTWDSDYNSLIQLLKTVAERFEVVTGKTEYVLDLEYKKVAPDGHLEIKQVRQIPQADTTPTIVPFLLKEPAEYVTYQGERGDVFAIHRTKLVLGLQTMSLWLSSDNLKQSFFSDATMDYAADGATSSVGGSLPSWSQAAHSARTNATRDSWSLSSLLNPRRYTLTCAGIPALVSDSQNPLYVLEDFGIGSRPAMLQLRVDYAHSVPHVNSLDPTTNTLSNHDEVVLWPAPQAESGDILNELTFEDRGVSIATSFYWPAPAPGLTAAYTAPLVRFVQTTITGLTSEPIVLKGYYSQSYRPSHHNLGPEDFLFEPRLEPGISQKVLSELKAKNICLIHKNQNNEIRTYGFDELTGDQTVMQQVCGYLLGTSSDATGLDVNSDSKVDVADLVRAERVRAPLAPWAPDPFDEDTAVPVNCTLMWQSDSRATSYDLYLWKSTSSAPSPATASGLTSASYQPAAALSAGTAYRWRVVAHGATGDSEGPVWSFTTANSQ